MEKVSEKKFSRDMFDEAEKDILNLLRFSAFSSLLFSSSFFTISSRRYSIYPLWKDSSYLKDELKRAKVPNLESILTPGSL